MIDVVFTVENVDMSGKLSTYQVVHEVEYPSLITALDGTEYGIRRIRPVINFSFIPLTETETKTFYNALSKSNVYVRYTDPNLNAVSYAPMRIASNLEDTFLLKSVTNDKYYRGGEIVLRQRTVI